MTNKKDKKIFDVWAENAENWNHAQQSWWDALDKMNAKSKESVSDFNGFFDFNPSIDNPFTANSFNGKPNDSYRNFLNKSGFDWEKCTSQYNDWLSAAKQWFPASMSATSFGQNTDGHTEASNFYFDALKTALNPSSFFQLCSNDLTKAFQKILNAPQFADIGLFENHMMQIMNDSSALQKASAEYQSLISSSWSKALSAYMEQTSEFFDKPFSENEAEQSVKDMIEQWLKIANQKLLDTQRSPEFLDAQKQLFKAATQCKEHQNSMMESWCESLGLPSRNEVDDLHKKVHELTREVRKLKAQLTIND